MSYLKAKKHIELKPEDLKWTCSPENFDFDTTEELKPIEGIIGQERAMKALKLGVDLRSQGYNIFITGLSGTGKLTTVKKMLEKISPECPEIFDYAFVNNFDDEDQPILLKFKAGKASKFKRDMGNSIQFLQENIPQVLESELFLQQKKKMIESYGQSQQALLNEFEKKLNKDNFALGQVKVGEMARPEILVMIENKPVFIQQLDELVMNKKITKRNAQNITKKYAAYQEEMQQLFRKSLQLNQQFKDKVKDLETSEVTHIVNATFDHLKSTYANKKVTQYIENVVKNILDNLDVFKGHRPTREETDEGVLVDYLKEYEINVVLDNTKVKACPVIIETSPTMSNLFGAIEKFSDGRGGWYADFTRIKAGSLLRANGGYIVINAMDAFSEPGVWRTLKRVLLYGKLEIQDATNYYQFQPSVLKPEAIDVDTKVLFIGSNYIFSLLSSYEDDFNKIFKVKAEFDYEMKRTEHTLLEYAKVIKKLVQTEGLLEFDSGAIAKTIEYAARYAGEKEKLTTRFAYIADLARESCFWARDNGDRIVSDYHVIQAYEAARERHGLYESKVAEMMQDGTILIDTDGVRIGQINGLAVYGGDHYSFGKPTRITASVSLGTGNIINVEREAGLSGSTHNKGVLIISGYFKETFGQNIPLSFNASLVFEQGYGMIDGDSASITEICALLSCLSGLPLRQNFAITGSVNQKGDIQPIGGVNEKIEGFYDVCKKKGLNKKQGVIIPEQNVKDLMLKDEITESVSKGEFHIYPVRRVEEAIEIFTGIKAGGKTKSGKYEINTVFGLVEKKLIEMKKKSKPPEKATVKRKQRKTKK
ncbi:MAG: AAA family ATPase [Melioribacteraceae bacterium]|nr:AAA family ATPase [Melioribacteraceae bacterium]